MTHGVWARGRITSTHAPKAHEKTLCIAHVTCSCRSLYTMVYACLPLYLATGELKSRGCSIRCGCYACCECADGDTQPSIGRQLARRSLHRVQSRQRKTNRD